MDKKKLFYLVVLFIFLIPILSGCTILSRIFGTGSNDNYSGYRIEGTVYYNGSVEPGYEMHFYVYIDPYDVNPSPEDNMRYDFSTNRTMDFSFDFEQSELNPFALLVYIDVNGNEVLDSGDYYAYFDPATGGPTDIPVQIKFETEGKIVVNFTFGDDFIWNGVGWNPKNYNGYDYEYMLLSNPDVSYFQGKITDVATDGSFLYMAGFYVTAQYQHRCFIYKVSPNNGSIIAKYETDVFNDDGMDPSTIIAPVLVEYESGYVYMAFTDLYDNVSYLFRLDDNLNMVDNLNSKVYPDYEIRDMVVDPAGEPDIYLTGVYNNSGDNDIFVERAPVTSAEQIHIETNAGDDAGNGIILYNGYIYVASLFDAYNDGNNYATIFQFDKAGLSDLNKIEVSNLAQGLGLCYNDYYGNFYMTGYQKAQGNNRYTLVSKIYTDLSNYDNNLSFDESSEPPTDINDESGTFIYYDPDNHNMVIPGYQLRTQSWDIDQKGSLTVLDTTGARKTIIFSDSELDSNYDASLLSRVVAVGDYYYAVGYTLKNIDGTNYDYRPLIVRMKR